MRRETRLSEDTKKAPQSWPTVSRMAYFLVRFGHGPQWNPSLARREQERWVEHAQFMDDRAARGMVALAGPVGDDVDTGDALVVVNATDASSAAAIFDDDPWHNAILSIRHIELWTFWLGPFASQETSRET